LSNKLSQISKYGKQIKNLGTWLFNLNIEGATSFLNSIEDTANKLELRNVDLLNYNK